MSTKWSISIFTHCHDEQQQRPNRICYCCCLNLDAVHRVHCSAHTATCPAIQSENWCVNRFLYGKNCSNENVWCASTTHLAGDESRNVWSIFAYIYTNCNSTAPFRPALRSDEEKTNVRNSMRIDRNVANLQMKCTSVKLDRQSAMLHTDRPSLSVSL